jgi:hypothetical protein
MDARSACSHADAVRVELLADGELVAWLCLKCDEQLPPEPDPRRAALARAVMTGALSPDEARAQMMAARVAAVKERFGG